MICDHLSVFSITEEIQKAIQKTRYMFKRNISFSKDVFPDALEIVRVIPLFKSGDKHVFTNYRLVSLLPQFSKIPEKLLIIVLIAFLKKKLYLE